MIEDIISFFTKFWLIVLIVSLGLGWGVSLFYPHVNQSITVEQQFQQATGTSIVIVPCDGAASSTIYTQILAKYTPKYKITDSYWAPPPKDAWYIELEVNQQ